MRKSQSDLLYVLGSILGMTMLFWLVVAEIVFMIRHPWATDMEHFIHIRQVLTFKFVPYNVMRERNPE